MRTSLSLLSGLFVLLFSFSSCLEEESATSFTPNPNLESREVLGTISYRGQESPLVAGYDRNGVITNSSNGAVNYATIVLANANMLGAGNRLTQTADALLINIMTDGSDISGTYRPSNWDNSEVNSYFSSNICTGLNFATGAMAIDEGIASGETTITDNGDGTHTIEFALQTHDRNVVSGSWTGPLTPTVD